MSGSSGGMVPNSNHAAQMLLRTDPESALGKYGFLVDNEVYTAGTIGGACSLGCTPLGGNIYRLTAKAGAGDFFYPYIYTSGGGVGECAVPVGQADGTIVVTGGMNGCSLQVNRHGGVFNFYHDNNGNSLTGKVIPGNIVARVDYKDYAGALELGSKLAAQMSHGAASSQTAFETYCITVRHGGRWRIYVSALLRTVEFRPASFFVSEKRTTSYQAFKPTIVPCMTSFEDA
jgi:hypothetical protein